MDGTRASQIAHGRRDDVDESASPHSAHGRGVTGRVTLTAHASRDRRTLGRRRRASERGTRPENESGDCPPARVPSPCQLMCVGASDQQLCGVVPGSPPTALPRARARPPRAPIDRGAPRSAATGERWVVAWRRRRVRVSCEIDERAHDHPTTHEGSTHLRHTHTRAPTMPSTYFVRHNAPAAGSYPADQRSSIGIRCPGHLHSLQRRGTPPSWCAPRRLA